MYRTLFTNARASALFVGAVVLMATAFVAGEDADTLLVNDTKQTQSTNHGSTSPAADNPPAAEGASDWGFMEDEELVQPVDGDEASPYGMGGPDDEAAPLDTAVPEAMETADTTSMEPEPDIDPSVSGGDL